MRETREEALKVFPNYAQQILVLDPAPNQVLRIKLEDHCCLYESPDKLRGVPEPYLELETNSESNLHSYKYFHDRPEIKAEVLRSFECAIKVVEKARKMSKQGQRMPMNESQISPSRPYHLCVHTHRGDFVDQGMGSQLEYSVNAVLAVHLYINDLRRQSHLPRPNVSTLLIGDDRAFMGSVKRKLDRKFHPTLLPAGLSRGEELCVGVQLCHSLLITAPTSSDGWWLGYLMAERRRVGEEGEVAVPDFTGLVFYNGDLSNVVMPGTYTAESFPNEWIPFDGRNFFSIIPPRQPVLVKQRETEHLPKTLESRDLEEGRSNSLLMPALLLLLFMCLVVLVSERGDTQSNKMKLSEKKKALHCVF